MANYRLSFFSPQSGAEVARTLTVLVTAFDNQPNQFPKRQTTSMAVQFGADTQPVPATKTGTSGWTCDGTLPSGVLHGQQVELTATASGLEFLPGTGPDGDPPDPTPFTGKTSVTVVAESAAPVLSVHAFPTDVVASTLPYTLPLSGDRHRPVRDFRRPGRPRRRRAAAGPALRRLLGTGPAAWRRSAHHLGQRHGRARQTWPA